MNGEIDLWKLVSQNVEKGGIIGGLLLFIWALAPERIVFGIQMRRERVEKDEWKRYAMRGTSLAESAMKREP